MRISEIMSRKVTSCAPEASIQDAARLMENGDCGAIPVVEVDSGKVVGILTDRDIACRAVAHGRNPQGTKVRDCMSNVPVTVKADMELELCCQIMEKEQVRRVPVVDETGKVCGIVSQADIAQKAPEHEVAEVVRDISRPSGRGIWAHTVP